MAHSEELQELRRMARDENRQLQETIVALRGRLEVDHAG
jgi:hypothetical protein